jgi:hypothetical protein
MVPEVGQQLARLAERDEWAGDDDLVFAEPHGEWLNDDRLRRRYDAALRAAGLRRLRFHDLRHTFGSLAIARGGHRRGPSLDGSPRHPDDDALPALSGPRPGRGAAGRRVPCRAHARRSEAMPRRTEIGRDSPRKVPLSVELSSPARVTHASTPGTSMAARRSSSRSLISWTECSLQSSSHLSCSSASAEVRPRASAPPAAIHPLSRVCSEATRAASADSRNRSATAAVSEASAATSARTYVLSRPVDSSSELNAAMASSSARPRARVRPHRSMPAGLLRSRGAQTAPATHQGSPATPRALRRKRGSQATGRSTRGPSAGARSCP